MIWEKVTVPAIQVRKSRPKIKMVTAYDPPQARINFFLLFATENMLEGT